MDMTPCITFIFVKKKCNRMNKLQIIFFFEIMYWADEQAKKESFESINLVVDIVEKSIRFKTQKIALPHDIDLPGFS